MTKLNYSDAGRKPHEALESQSLNIIIKRLEKSKPHKKGVCMLCVCRNAKGGATMMNVTCKSSGPTFSRTFLFPARFFAVNVWDWWVDHDECDL